MNSRASLVLLLAAGMASFAAKADTTRVDYEIYNYTSEVLELSRSNRDIPSPSDYKIYPGKVFRFASQHFSDFDRITNSKEPRRISNMLAYSYLDKECRFTTRLTVTANFGYFSPTYTPAWGTSAKSIGQSEAVCESEVITTQKSAPYHYSVRFIVK